jgi:hypothetical protein
MAADKGKADAPVFPGTAVKAEIAEDSTQVVK